MSVNLVAAVTFALTARALIDWPAVGLIAVGATLGGVAGARLGRRMSPALLRGIIAVVGVTAVVVLTVTP